jgi:peptidyl-tRNA hydrolase, PTH2 family
MLDAEKGEVTARDTGRSGVDGDDELRIYIVVRRDVGEQMSKTKFGVQCAHAALTTWVLCLERDPDRAWAYTGVAQAKIVLQVDTEAELRELHEQARAGGYAVALITDAGRTQLEPTTTALAIGPIWFKGEGKLVRRLRLYKEKNPNQIIEEPSDERLEELWYQAGGADDEMDNFYRMVDEHGRQATEMLLNDLTWADRRVALYKLQPHCPACHHEQVQLMNMYVTPAEWRCRACKHKFARDLEYPR